jgi:hypothetical protein
MLLYVYIKPSVIVVCSCGSENVGFLVFFCWLEGVGRNLRFALYDIIIIINIIIIVVVVMMASREDVSCTGDLQHVGFMVFPTYTILVLGQG